MAKIRVNLWDFGPLGNAIKPRPKKEADFQHLPLLSIVLLISFIQQKITKAIKEGTTFVNSNYKSSHVAFNFMVIFIMLIRRVCVKSLKNSFIEKRFRL